MSVQFLIFVLSICQIALAVDYCNLCPKRQHIACDNDGKFASSCPKSAKIINLSNFKDLIVDKHNELRNRIASGQLSPFKSASRMATMQWDNELAYLAELNLKTCKFDHDCHNTKEFEFSGQNLFWFGGGDEDVKGKLLDAINGWFNEYKNANNKIIEKFPPNSDPKKEYGHFTVMAVDKNYKVGCAMLKVQKGETTEYSVTCNYAYTNVLTEAIYKFGPAAKECKSGTNPKYPSLCSINEKYVL